MSTFWSRKRRVTAAPVIAIGLLVMGAVVGSLSGCGATELTVEAPPGVSVKSASVDDEGLFKCDFTSSVSGELEFSLGYSAASEHIVDRGVIRFTEEVSAGQAQSILRALPLDYGTIEWGTLVLGF